MASFGKDFRDEALAKPGGVVWRNVGGWRFGLSFGQMRTPTREEYEHVKRGRGSQYANTQVAPALPPTYEEFVKKFEYTQETLRMLGITDKTWCLSASLWPRGRSSTKKDWEYLGQMTAAIGAPMDALKTPLQTTNPSDVHYWVWEEGAKN